MSGKSKPKRRIKKLISRKPKGIEKPKEVTITGPLSVNAVQQMDGSVSLIIIALGDDQRVYSWEGAKKAWYMQG